MAETVRKINGQSKLRDHCRPQPQMSIKQAVTRWAKKYEGNYVKKYEKTKTIKFLLPSFAGLCDAQLSLHIIQGNHLKERS